MPIVSQSLGDIISGLNVAEGEINHIMEAALRDVGQSALQHFRQSWPVDSGESLSGWTYHQTGLNGTLSNNVPYTSYVHQGLADRLWADVMRAAEKDVTLLLSERVTALLRKS